MIPSSYILRWREQHACWVCVCVSVCGGEGGGGDLESEGTRAGSHLPEPLTSQPGGLLTMSSP